MSSSHTPRDHSDLLRYSPHAPSAAPLSERRPANLLVHSAHAPSGGDYATKPAPFGEDGVSFWTREGTKERKEQEEEEEEKAAKENEALWNVKRRTPVKMREGEFEQEFRSRGSYSGRVKEGEEDGAEEKEQEKVLIPRHMRNDPIWNLK